MFLFSINLNFVFAENTDNASQNQNKSIILKADNLSENLDYSTLADWFNFSPYLTVNNNYYSEIENIDNCIFDKISCEFNYSVRENGHIYKKTDSSIDKNKINFYLTVLAEKFNQEPVNAQIDFDLETNKLKVTSPEKNGVILNVEKSTDEIYNKISVNNDFPKEINLIYDIKKAEIRSDNLDSLGIKEMIGEGYSKFIGSTPTRIYNIKTAIKHFDGWIIKPNEEASFANRVGEVSGATGYKEELVIKNNKTEKEFGGGLCQVSTTVFRAAIYSGLKITARRNHAYPVSYYNPQGMDAAVYVPNLDLKFVNNTNNYILVKVEIDEETKELFFRFYGTKDDRNVEIKGPFVIQKNPDGSLKTYFTQKVTEDGKVIVDDTFKSSYNSPNNYPHT